MATVPTADLIAVTIGIAAAVMAVAASMAPVIIIVAVVFVVAVTPPLGHSDCRRKRER
jgi:Flp pilus assembly protein TadB